MTRQNPLSPGNAALPKDASGMIQPVDMASMIPTAKQAKENAKRDERGWEKKNPSSSYRVPSNLCIRAKDINASLVNIAAEFMTTSSSAAAALIAFSLSHLREGRLMIEARPTKPERRTLSLDWTETESGWPKEVKAARKKKKDDVRITERPVFLSYRWGADIDKQIEAVAKRTGVPGGEVVVFLLNYAIKAYQDGHLSLVPKSVVVANKVTPSSAC